MKIRFKKFSIIFFQNKQIRPEDIENLKKADLLEILTKEFGQHFPEFKRVLIDERDMYLTSSLRDAYQPIPNDLVPGGK